MKPDIIIAIDPDVNKSGVAYLNRKTRSMELADLPFPELIDYLQFSKETESDFIVVIEAGWLNKSNFHVRKGDSIYMSAAKGSNVGRNEQTGRLISEMCEHLEIPFILQKPLRKHWKGQGKKITHKELSYFTGISGETNQEKRDAALLAWHYAGLPIKKKV